MSQVCNWQGEDLNQGAQLSDLLCWGVSRRRWLWVDPKQVKVLPTVAEGPCELGAQAGKWESPVLEYLPAWCPDDGERSGVGGGCGGPGHLEEQIRSRQPRGRQVTWCVCWAQKFSGPSLCRITLFGLCAPVAQWGSWLCPLLGGALVPPLGGGKGGLSLLAQDAQP